MPHFALFLLKVRSLDHEELKEYIGIPNKAPQLLLRYCCAFLVPVFLFMTMQPRFLSACILGQLCLQHVMFYMVVSITYPFFEPTNHIDCWHVPYNCDRTTTKTLLSPMVGTALAGLQDLTRRLTWGAPRAILNETASSKANISWTTSIKSMEF